MKRSDSIANIIPALIKAQTEINNATLDSKNPHFKSEYASLESVLDAVKPALNKYGLLLIQPVSLGEDGKPYIETTIIHESGEWLGSLTPVIFEKVSAQAAGSGYTYARRYSLQAMMAIGAEDDDGNGAEDKGNKDKVSDRGFQKPPPAQRPPARADASAAKDTAPGNTMKTAGDFMIKFGEDKGRTLAQLGPFAVSKKVRSIKESKKSDFKDSTMAKEFFHWAEHYLRKNPVDELDMALGDNKPALGDVSPPDDWASEPIPEWDGIVPPWEGEQA